MSDLLHGAIKFVFIVALTLGVAASVLRIFFVDVAEIGHNAMAPTVFSGDRILIWRKAALEVGDIALCEHPNEPGRFILGRVLAKPGFNVEMVRGALMINGQIPDVDYREIYEFHDPIQDETFDMKLGIEKLGKVEHLIFMRANKPFVTRKMNLKTGLYLLSDNRTYWGEDTRTVGEIDPALCKGEAFMRLSPSKTVEVPKAEEIRHKWFDILR